MQEFVRRAQEAQPHLIVASGLCDVYTGIGDPYLPFRDVMSMLTGDVETRRAAGAISRDHAVRLWHLLPDTVRLLVDCGPDLIDTFVAGGPLAERAGTYAGSRVDWLKRLQELISRRALPSGWQAADRTRLFEEFTDVLTTLAKQQPLLLILDDLHWADLSSIGLLSHLGRRITTHSMLIVGAYRPEDVALGRDGERHPLEDILSEFKRQFGNVWVRMPFWTPNLTGWARTSDENWPGVPEVTPFSQSKCCKTCGQEMIYGKMKKAAGLRDRI
jgi:hypothetical protein